MKSWDLKRLGDLCDLIGGGTPPKNIPDFYGGNIPWATVRDMRHDVITSTEFTITKEAVKSCSTKIVPAGNLIVATRVGLGKVCTVAQDTAINQDLRGVIPRNPDAVLTRFLFWWFKSISNKIIAAGSGATVQGIKLPFLASLNIPLPPPAEQHRIVKLLDEAFTAIDIAKANTEKNLKNAREVFESHLNSVFTQRGEGCVETVLADVVEFSAGYAFKSSEYVKAGNAIRLLRGDNIVQGKFRWDDAVYWSNQDTVKYERFFLEETDIVLAMDRPLVSSGLKIAFVSKEDLPCLQVQRTARLRVSEKLFWRYLFYLLQSNRFIDHLLKGQTGLGVPHVSGKQILSFRFFQPTILEQELVVNSLDSIASELKLLEEAYSRKLESLIELRASLLNQAFSGNL